MTGANHKMVIVIRSRGTDSAAYKMARTLARGGYAVDLLIWNRGGRVMEEPGRQYRVHTFELDAPLDRIEVIPFLPLFWLYELAFLIRHRAQVYHACDLDTFIPAILAAKISGAKLAYSIFDFYANNLPRGSLGSVGTVGRGLVEKLEKFAIGLADVVYLADESRLDEIKGARAKKIVILYNSPEDMLDKAEVRRTDGSRELVVFYGGLLIREVRGIEHAIEALRGLSGISLVLAGTGPDESYFRYLALENTNVRFLGWIPRYDDLVREELMSDVLFRLSDPALLKTKYESPNKVFEAMMCGKPIIISEGIAASRIVRSADCGIVIPFGDPVAMRAALSLLASDFELRQRLGQNGRRAYVEKYGWDLMKARLLASYEGLGLRCKK